MKKSVQVAIVMLASAVAGSAWAQTLHTDVGSGNIDSRIYKDGDKWVEEMTGSLPGARNLKVVTDMGSVTVVGANQPNVTFVIRKRTHKGGEQTARKLFQAFAINVVRKADTVYVEGEWQGPQKMRSVSTDFTLTVPRELTIGKVETSGGSVDMRNLAGQAFAATAGGSITLDQIGGAVRAETSGGSIDVGAVGGDAGLSTSGGSIAARDIKGRLLAETAGGSIEVGTVGNGAVLNTAGGSIQVSRCDKDLHAETAGGSIQVGKVNGGVVLVTAGGGIHLESATGPVRAETAGGGLKLLNLTQGVRAETAGGPIFAEFLGRGKFTDSHLETQAGDIIVYLAPAMGVTVRGVVDLGDGHWVKSDFSELRVTTEGGNWGPKQIFVEGSINGGGPVLKLHTTNGNIEIRRGKK
ncbi:MAG TPA: hypothetical protein VLE48_11050 [Terriglobales bacterium]|nr:hypothetical protein [Terriglobales bacterium]